MPLAWLVFDFAGGFGRRGLVAFLVIGALWVEGQGMHLAANAIGDAFPSVHLRALNSRRERRSGLVPMPPHARATAPSPEEPA